LISAGERVIGAAWLLWLVAVFVLLLNAAYRDGTTKEPYPRLIGIALRWIVPLLVLIAFTAIYAMYLRVARYGFTVERVWACIVASAACLYSIGYGFAARDGQPWMANIARVNVAVALFLIAVLALSLTPVLSPYRIAATSQYAQVLERWPPEEAQYNSNAMSYLRLSSGQYGRARLQRLASIKDVPNAETIRADAQDALEHGPSFQVHRTPSMVEQSLASLTIHPRDHAVEASLVESLKVHLGKPENTWLATGSFGMLGVFVDLNDAAPDEFVLISGMSADVFEQRDEVWRWAARFGGKGGDPKQTQSAVANGEVEIAEPKWKELRIGPTIFRDASSAY